MTANKHRASISREAQRAAFDVKDLMSATEALLRSTGSYTGAEIVEARARVAQQLEVMQGTAGQWNQRVKDRYHDAVDMTDEYVHHKPWRVVAMAAAAGVIAGLCFGNSDRQQ